MTAALVCFESCLCTYQHNHNNNNNNNHWNHEARHPQLQQQQRPHPIRYHRHIQAHHYHPRSPVRMRHPQEEEDTGGYLDHIKDHLESLSQIQVIKGP